MVAGQTTAVSATLKDRNGVALTGRGIAWSSSNKRVATVDANGNIAALSAGTTTITALSEGVSAAIPIVITAPAGTVAPAITTVSPALLTPGSTATIDGATLSTRPRTTASTSSGVRGDGVPSRPTQPLTATVPVAAFLPCKSTQPVDVEVLTTVAGTALAKRALLSVATQRNLAVGASFMVTASGNIACNELPAAGTYVVSVFNASKSLNKSSAFELQGSGAATLASKLAPSAALRSIEVIGPPATRRDVVDPIIAQQAEDHLARLEQDQQIFRALGSPRRYRGPRGR